MPSRTVRFLISVGTLLLLLLSLIYMLVFHDGMLQTSADFGNETAIWQVWILSVIPLVLCMFIGDKNLVRPLYKDAPRSTWILVALAVIFIVLMVLTPEAYVFDLFYVYKLVLLFIIPLIIMKKDTVTKVITIKTVRRWGAPLLVVTVWLTLYILSPLSEAHAYEIDFLTLAFGAFISLMLNSVLEELFYRVWLQSRLESALGIWPAICVSALLWALWHTGIQGSGGVLDSAAHALVLHGIMGLFFGYFWAKYRNVWLLILMHGLMNLPMYLFTMWFE